MTVLNPDAQANPPPTKSLEVQHSYYCSSESYTENGAGERYDSWGAFFESYADSDKDYNFLFRWDWVRDEDDPNDITLRLFFVLQRKGRFWPVVVKVLAEDEPAVQKFLQPYWEHLRDLWAPISNVG